MLELCIFFDVDGLEKAESECSIETAAISARLAIGRKLCMQVLYFIIEALVVNELIEHQRNWSQLTNQGRFSLNLHPNHALLLLYQLQLLFILSFLFLIHLLLLLLLLYYIEGESLSS